MGARPRYPDFPQRARGSPVQRFSEMCGLREIHHPQPEREKYLLRLLHLQEPLPDGLHSIKHNRLEAAGLADVLARLNAERAELLNGVDKEHPALVAFAKYQSIETLTREILTDLVDHIKIYENGNISVHFKFADEVCRYNIVSFQLAVDKFGEYIYNY